MFSEKSIEGIKMSGFLVVHMLHQRAQVRVGGNEGRGLCRVDERGSQFTSLINAELRRG
jgi:hypothetical protein